MIPNFDTIVYLETINPHFIRLMALSSKHKKTLKAIFDDPTRSDIAWSRIESLLVALNAELSEGKGSRIVSR